MQSPQNNDKIYDTLYDFTGCRVVIPFTDMGISSHETKIIEHNRQFHTIKIKIDGANFISSLTHISIVIFTKDDILHFMGSVRKSFDINTIEIAIYNGKHKEDRRNPRYDISSCGLVSSLCISRQFITLRTPLMVNVINISSSGALVRTLPNAFFKGSIFSLDLELNGSEMKLMCLVVRVNELDAETANYGCEFVPVEHNHIVGGLPNES